MTQRRKAEAREVRTWQGDVAAANELDEVRHWVVWGFGPPSERSAEEPDDGDRPPSEPGNDVADAIARGRDPEWAAEEGDRWVVILRADEDDVDEWVDADETVRGYAPYLLERDATRADTDAMRGVLRPDRVRRRRFDTGRPD